MNSNRVCSDWCSNCCTPVLMNGDFVEENKQFFQREIYNMMKFPNDLVLVVTRDMKCVFLNQDNKCSIYVNRPDTCRKYTCEYLRGESNIPPEKGSMMCTSINSKKVEKTGFVINSFVFIECVNEEEYDPTWNPMNDKYKTIFSDCNSKTGDQNES